MTQVHQAWPRLEWAEWRESAVTLQLWTQIVGKVRLALTPWLNHGWHVPLYVSPRGLTTSSIPCDDGLFELEFDFVRHFLAYRDSSGNEDSLPLQPQSVADFHNALLALLGRNGIEARISPLPNEIEDPIPFDQDRVHASYDPEAVQRFWRALVSTGEVFSQFRTGFLGKSSPVHFFWGSFDLAVTRFSGKPAPLHPGGVPHLSDAVTREAYSHEVSSAGFWPGSDAFPHAAFYSYAYPMPSGFAEALVRPPASFFDPGLGEFLLKYEDVRSAEDPGGDLMAFLTSTYEAAAIAGGWDREALECPPGLPGRPRVI